MPTHIVLLRAVNVSGTGLVAMAQLREALAAVGFERVRTLLQSGNVVLDASCVADPAFERGLERELFQRLTLRTTVFIRSAAEWEAMIAANPFAEEARDDPSHLLAVLASTDPTPAALAKLRSSHDGPERIAAGERHVMIHYPAGIGRSKLTTSRIEKALGGPVTGRNWNTVSKLRDLART